MMTASPPGPKHAKQTYRVLCVDDNEFGLFVNTVILRNEGYEVLTSSDALKAASIAASQEIDVAILDYQMPFMSGAELAAICKAANPDVRVIFYSGTIEMPNWELALADLFVSKSDGIQALLEGIEALLSPSELPTTAPRTTTA
jgi:CheY-like chemotaxis protein